tara:strand:+ start:1447 stop:2124 length:678 start_codon:yes stop_codon:yes gene_type:complete
MITKNSFKKFLKRSSFIVKVIRLLRYILLFLRLKFNQFGSKRKWKYLLQNDEIKLNLGSGQQKGRDGWINVDQNKSDINWDLRRGIPLPDSSVDIIYSSHLLEHIPFKELKLFLNECRRVLKENGEMKVAVPNAGLYIDAYNKNFNFRPKESMKDHFHNIDTGSRLDQINLIAYMGDEHKYMFDEENLINTLTSSGFSKACPREFDISIDSKDRDFESVYAVAYK